MAGEKLSTENLALNAARRQKRLAYWREQFLIPGTLSDGEKSRLEDMFGTYQLLISRLIKAQAGQKAGNEGDDLNEVESRLSAFDRQFNEIFGAKRLMTSQFGTSAVKD